MIFLLIGGYHMKELTVLEYADMSEEIMKIYNQLTPENKQKAIEKYQELLAEQEAEKV